MKTSMKAKSLMMLSIMMMIAVTISAQRMHKHPRVTVKTNKVDLNKNNTKEAEKLVMPITTTVLEEETVANTEIENVELEVAVASTETKTAVNNVRKNLVKSFEMKDVKSDFDLTTYGQQLTEHSRLMKVKEVQKTALESWLMWMIILFSAALLFTILAVVFIFVFFAMSIIFWIFAALCYLGGFIVLVLGLTGVI